jgi:hypothetical protein
MPDADPSLRESPNATPTDAMCACDLTNPLSATKRLQDLLVAQAGVKEPVFCRRDNSEVLRPVVGLVTVDVVHMLICTQIAA